MMSDNYYIEESAVTFSFKPFHSYRNKLKWYVLAILIFAGLSTYFYMLMNVFFLIISITFLVSIFWYFLINVFFIPIRYTFDQSTNSVFQSTLFLSKKKLMNLNEVVVYKSSEMGHWQYKMGKKRSQLVKSYAISIYFSDKSKNETVTIYEREILCRIDQLVSRSQSIIPINAGD